MDDRARREALPHLTYEIDMVRRIAEYRTGRRSLSEVERLMSLEAFLLHLRVLLEFLAAEPKKGFPDDVLAERLAPDWPRERHADLLAIKKRIDQHLAHLTTIRSAPAWQWVADADAMAVVLVEFVTYCRSLRTTDAVAGEIGDALVRPVAWLRDELDRPRRTGIPSSSLSATTTSEPIVTVSGFWSSTRPLDLAGVAGRGLIPLEWLT